MEDILGDLELLENADQLCVEAARSLLEHGWLTKQVDAGDFDMAKFSEYNRRMGGARLQPQERCRSLEECLGKLSRRSKDMLDDGCTVNEIYLMLQNELYRQVWRYHLALAEDDEENSSSSRKPYFDRVEEETRDQRQLLLGCAGQKRMAATTAGAGQKTATTTMGLLKDLAAVQRMRVMAVTSPKGGEVMHEPGKKFRSYQELVQFTTNVFESFDASMVSRAFGVDEGMCKEFGRNLLGMRQGYHAKLAEVLCGMSGEGLEELRRGRPFDELEAEWHAEIERRNRELCID